MLDSGYSLVMLITSLYNYGYLHVQPLARRRGKNVGTLCSTWNVEMGICTCEWVCRSCSLVIPIGKSNTPLMHMHSYIFGFEKVPVCVLVSSESRGPLCGGLSCGVLLCSNLSCWFVVATTGNHEPTT